MNVANEVMEIKVTKKALKEFRDIIEAETGRLVTNPLKLLHALLQADVRGGALAAYTYSATDSGCMKHDWPGLKKNKRK